MFDKPCRKFLQPGAHLDESRLRRQDLDAQDSVADAVRWKQYFLRFWREKQIRKNQKTNAKMDQCEMYSIKQKTRRKRARNRESPALATSSRLFQQISATHPGMPWKLPSSQRRCPNFAKLRRNSTKFFSQSETSIFMQRTSTPSSWLMQKSGNNSNWKTQHFWNSGMPTIEIAIV